MVVAKCRMASSCTSACTFRKDLRDGLVEGYWLAETPYLWSQKAHAWCLSIHGDVEEYNSILTEVLSWDGWHRGKLTGCGDPSLQEICNLRQTAMSCMIAENYRFLCVLSIVVACICLPYLSHPLNVALSLERVGLRRCSVHSRCASLLWREAPSPCG